MSTSATHRLPGVDFTTLSRRRHVEKAVANMRQARQHADAESARTIRECNLDAVVKSQRAAQPQRPQPSTRSPVAIAASLPPYILAAALAAVFVLVGGLLSLSNSAKLRNAVAGPLQWRDVQGELLEISSDSYMPALRLRYMPPK